MFNRVKEAGGKVCTVAGKVKNKAELLATGLMCEAMLMQSSFAKATSGSGEADNVVKTAVDMVVNIFPLVGAFFVVAGVFKLVMAYRNNQPEDQTTAAKDIVIGAVLIVFRAFAWTPISNVIF